VAGKPLGAVRPRMVGALLLPWVAARATFLLAPGAVWSGVARTAFAGAPARRIDSRPAGVAKKWRNRALPGVLATLCVMPAYWQLARPGPGHSMSSTSIVALEN